MAPTDPVDTGITDLDPVISLEIPNDAYRPKVIGPTQMQNFVDDLWLNRRGMAFGNGLLAN
jgi:hypothetical protein